MAAPQRRRKMIGRRRRVEDEGDEEAGMDHIDLDDDSLSDGSLGSDDVDPADDSDTSNVDDGPPNETVGGKTNGRKAHTNGKKKSGQNKPSTNEPRVGEDRKDKTSSQPAQNGVAKPEHEDHQQEVKRDDNRRMSTHSTAPIIVSSSAAVSASRDQSATRERPKKEHDEYRRKRDEDPAFVPNRGAFFMHDHRHAGPSANGFRPFGRGGRGRGRGGGIGGPFAPMNQHLHHPADPIVSAPWAHDMHETVSQPPSMRPPRQSFTSEAPLNGDGIIPTCPTSSDPINRKMSHEKHLGNVQIRVFISPMKDAVVFPGIPVKQYTKLPDHRPPLRRDKPVRISLPDFPQRYVFPATDRSFIFIPRALRPNQQRLRGKPTRSGLGSIGGYSRRTSIVGGSYYAGSAYSPSVDMSRRSSIVMDMGRNMIASPTGSTISRAPMAHDAARPVVRLPPSNRPEMPSVNVHGPMAPSQGGPYTNRDMAPPQTHPLPQKPMMQETRTVQIPMHQPRPQKHLSVADIEPASQRQAASQPYEQAFHQQVPVQVSNTLEHSRHASYPSQHSTGTPLSQIPERAIHAAPFHPTHFAQQQAQQTYYPQYPMMQPQYGHYYPQGQYAAAPNSSSYSGMPQTQPQVNASQAQAQGGPGSVAHEANGMVYYYDAAQMPPPMTTYNPYSAPPQSYPMPGGMNGMVTPSPDGFYYPPSNTVYYS